VSLTRPDNPLRVGIVGGIVIIGVTLLIIGGHAQVTGPATIQRTPEILALEPNESDQLLPQGVFDSEPHVPAQNAEPRLKSRSGQFQENQAEHDEAERPPPRWETQLVKQVFHD